MSVFLLNKPRLQSFLVGFPIGGYFICADGKSCFLNEEAISESGAAQSFNDSLKAPSTAKCPTPMPQGRTRSNHFKWLLLKPLEKTHGLPFKLLKNAPVEKLFLPTLNPLCCTVSPPPPVWILGKLQKSFPWDSKKEPSYASITALNHP